MKAVVFTIEPGEGQAFLKEFVDEEQAAAYGGDHGCLVFDADALAVECVRLRRWLRQAQEEVCAAERKLRHARSMLERLTGSERAVGVW